MLALHFRDHGGKGLADETFMRLVFAHADAVFGEDCHIDPIDSGSLSTSTPSQSKMKCRKLTRRDA